ncbi:MAG: lipoyl(octanoyl) transferase LipB [Holosporales bacterium]|jgi:lipoyl(octanoyl) transferase|nr:lipoyl(octanoyl) transferase LipB [Holosporales bacterium]
MIFIRQEQTRYVISMMDMELAVEGVRHGQKECVIITEHETVYTAGRSTESMDFLKSSGKWERYPIYHSKRGGRVTVHSPGQIVVYPIINLRFRGLSVTTYVSLLEEWIINALATFYVKSFRSDHGIGVWTPCIQSYGETVPSKIGFVGIRIVKGIASHGFCINVNNDLMLFNDIIPCGLHDVRITSLKNILGAEIEMETFIYSIIQSCPLRNNPPQY